MDNPAESIEFTIIFLLILVNAFFVLNEAAITESHKTKLERIADSGNRKARLALQIIEEPNQLLATMQIGITLTSLVIGALAGAKLTPVLTIVLASIAGINGYADILALLCSIMIIMYLVLVLGELIPKQIAANIPEAIVIKFATILTHLESMARPLVNFLKGSTAFILLFIGVNPSKETTVTEEEVRTLIEQGTEDGTFEKSEQAMVDRIFRLSDQNACALMTPRTQLLWLDLEDSQEHNLAIIQENSDTIFPVGRDSLDNFIGILYTKDLLTAILKKQPIRLQQHVRKPMFIPKSMQSFKILENFKASGIHEAVVLDEFGGVVGLITMTDIIAEVVGDISSNTASEPEQIIKRDENSWLVDGLLPINEFKECFSIDNLPDEDRDQYQTMGGFITSYLGYIPTVAEKFTWNTFTFEIVDMDRVRIDKVLVSKKSTTATTDESMAS